MEISTLLSCPVENVQWAENLQHLLGREEESVDTKSGVEMHSSELGLLGCERVLPPTWQRSGGGGGGHLQFGNAAEPPRWQTEQHPGRGKGTTNNSQGSK